MAADLQPLAEDCPPPPPRLSFRDAVSRPKIPINEITDIKHGSTFKGEPALHYSLDEVSQLAAPFEQVLVGKFAEVRPNMEFLRKGFQIIGFKGDVSLGLLDSHHILIRFSLHEDYYRCWMRGSWSFKKHVMKVLKWTPDFTADHEPPVAPVWISFHHLPLHLFQKGPLMSLATLIGRPLRIDAATRSLTRPSVARICVEVNLLHALPKRIWIGHGDSGFWQAVAYDNLPLYCTSCSRLGHAKEFCGKEPVPSSTKLQPPPQHLQVWKAKPPVSTAVHPHTSGLTTLKKHSVPMTLPDTDVSAPPSITEAVTATSFEPVPEILPPTSDRVLADSHASLLSDALPETSKLPPTAPSQDVPVVNIPSLSSIPEQPLIIVADKDISSDEDAAFIIMDNPPILGSSSRPNSLPNLSEPSSPVASTEHSLSQPDPVVDGGWSIPKTRKPHQKRDFGASHMVTRSKASFTVQVSND